MCLYAGEEADEDLLEAELAAERSRAAHARSAALSVELEGPGGGRAEVSRSFSYYALEGATGAVRWRHDVRGHWHWGVGVDLPCSTVLWPQRQQ